MTDWNKLKVNELKAELKQRGLPQTGLKAALVARLEAADSDVDNTGAAVETALNTEPATNEEVQDDEAIVKPPSELETPAEDVSEVPQDALHPSNEPHAPESPASLPIQDAPQPVDVEPTETTANFGSQSPRTTESLPQTNTSEAVQNTIAPSSPGNAGVAELEHIVTLGTDTSTGRDGADTAEELAATKDLSTDIQMADSMPTDTTSEQTPAAPSLIASSIEASTESRSIPPQEAVEDKIDRKRRSRSPPPVADEVVMKRARVEDDHGTADKAESTAHQDRPVTEEHRPKDTRFKQLFAPTKVEEPAPEIMDTAADTETVVAAAVHPATCALYIRDFMRPLNAAALREHLVSLATPSGATPDHDIFVNFFLDQIRTHAFVVFKTTTAAARVRGELHDRIWPDERTRKPLWVDYVPEHKVAEWIAEEQAVPGRSSKKWEVFYNEDEEGNVTASLQEAGATPAQRSRPAVPQGAPLGPRGEPGRRQPPPSSSAPALDMGPTKTTTARPAITYAPVSKELADRRIDELAAITRKGYRPNLGSDADIHRYTYEKGDLVVDRGPEIFPGIRPPNRGRGSYRGGGGGGGDRYGGWSSRHNGNNDRGFRDFRDRDRRW